MHRPVELTSLFDDLARAGQGPTTIVLDYSIGLPSREVVQKLNV